MDENISPTFKKERYEWLRTKTALDLFEIDNEVIEMSVLLQEAGEYTSVANETRDRAKEELQATVAAISHGLREDKTAGKRSESAIESLIPIMPGYAEKLQALDTARLDASLWASLTDALRSKSMAIRVAADLLNSGWLTVDYIRNKRRKEIREAGAAK